MGARGLRAPSDILRRQRAAAEKLRKEVLGGFEAHHYFREFRSQVQGYRREISARDLADACARADLIYLGEFHALPACQRFAADLLTDLAGLGRPLILGVEFVYTRQQPLLDRRQSGDLSDESFLRRIHYREEWGYPWDGYREILDRARFLGVPARALDSSPRAGVRTLSARDDHAARQIELLVSRHPSARILVLFGESHLAPSHLPGKVRVRLERVNLARRSVTVLQDPDAVYWAVASGPPPHAKLVEVQPDLFAVLASTPLEKYESYRQVLERWRDDVPPDEEVDLTPAVHHLIYVLLRWLGIRPVRFRVRHRAGWEDELSDTLPEVYSGPEAAEMLSQVFSEHRRTAAEIEEGTRRLALQGALYESRSNVMFVSHYLPGRAAGEGARYLRAALSGGLYDPVEESWPDPAVRAYGSAYNEALAFLGARLVDPAGDTLTTEESASLLRPTAVAADELEEFAERLRWLEAHRRFEDSGDGGPPEELLAPLRSRRELRRVLAREIGHHLGRVLLDRVRKGTLGARGLREIFSRTLSADDAATRVLELLRSKAHK